MIDYKSGDCLFCGFKEQFPELVIYETGSWSIFHHTRKSWPTGTLTLVSRNHGMLSDISADNWRDAAPLMTAVSRMQIDLCQAERTYLLSFSEVQIHFHLVMIPKKKEHSVHYGGRFGLDLLNSFLTNGPPASITVPEMMAMYRNVVDAYVATARAGDVPNANETE